MRNDMGKINVPSQQRNDEPCFQDVGLWRRMLTRAQEGGLTNHHFFVIDVEEVCLHSSRFCTLGLPSLFMEHHRKRLKERITLEGADGHKWLTVLGLRLDLQHYCLNVGWQDFAADHNLAINDQIVFLLFEDSHFLVQVFDANSNFKGRVLASPERAGDGRVRVTSQVGMQQRKEASLAEKKTKPNVQVQEQRQGTSYPLLYDDTEMDWTPRDGSPSLKADLSSVPRSKGKDVIELPDSSEEDEPIPTIRPASGIKMRAKQTVSRCSIKVTRVDAEDQTQATQEDVSDCIRQQTPRQSNRLAGMAEQDNLTQKLVELDEEQVQSDYDQNGGTTVLGDGNGSIRDVMASPFVHRPFKSRSPPSSITAPSSPERVTVLKRSRKLQRKSGHYEEDEDYIDPSSRKLDSFSKVGKATERSENASVPGVNAECNPVETSTGRPKRDAVVSRANKLAEMMAAEAPKEQPRRVQQDNKKKKAPENLPKGMKKTPATDVVADDVADRGTEAIPQENGGSKGIQSAPSQMPVGVGSRAPVISRHKVKVHKKREKSCSQPEEEPKVVFKRPAKIPRLGPAKAQKIMYISKRRSVTDHERNDILVKAQEYAQNSINKHYVMQLRVSQVYCGYHLGVSKEFVEQMQLPRVTQTMTFFDITGKTWEVEWQGDHPLKPGFNSKGWTKFLLDHCLEEGDVCVFELPDPKVFNISVTIFPIVPLGKIPELRWKSHYGITEGPTVEKSEPTAQSPLKTHDGFAIPRSPVKTQNGLAASTSQT